MKHLLTSAALGLCVLAVNPMVACQSDEGDEVGFEFGEADMRQAVAGSYVGKVISTGESVRITLDQTGAPSARSTQHYKRVQCSTRSFVKPAAACVDSTTMELTAHVTSERPEMAALDLTGTFEVYGYELSGGSLFLGHAGASFIASFSLSAGGLIHWSFKGAGEAVELALTKETAQ